MAYSLLERQLNVLVLAFQHKGDFTERLYRVRQKTRQDSGNRGAN